MAEATVRLTEAAQSAAQTTAITGSGASVMAQTLLWLMVIIGLILALAWVAKRFSNGTGFGSQGMKVISALPVGNRERIALVQVGDKQILLGIAPGNVSKLHVFDEPVMPAPAASGSSAVSSASGQRAGFQSVLKNALNRNH